MSIRQVVTDMETVRDALRNMYSGVLLKAPAIWPQVYNYNNDKCGIVHITIGDGGNQEGLSGLNYQASTNGADPLAHRAPLALVRVLRVVSAPLWGQTSCPLCASEICIRTRGLRVY